MNNKLDKLKMAFLIICLPMLLILLSGSQVLAQEQIRKYFEITGGKSEAIPIQLKVGQMVQGELIIERTGTIRISLSDFTGKSMYLFGETSTRGGFYYAAEKDGQYYIVVTNPNAYYVGTIGCTVNYSIIPIPTNAAPGTCSGKKVTEDVTEPSPLIPAGWWIVGGIIALVLLVLFAKVKSRDHDDEDEYEIILRRKK
jgi:hypothetical protein